jgi:two-component system nitrate/nitrite response regulator NarL
VLIVDDHDSFRASAKAMLEADGYDVVGEAEDVRSALAATRKLRPDVVLLDVRLPDGSGIDLVPTLCEQDDQPAVVLISSREAVDYGARLTTSGALGFIAKHDLTVDTLRDVLKGDACSRT